MPALENLIKAVNNLTAAIEAGGGVSASPAANTTSAASETTAAAPAEAPAAPEEPTVTVTVDDARAALAEFAKENGRKGAIALLNEFGVESISKLDAELLPALIEKAKVA